MTKKCLLVDDVEVSRFATTLIFEELGIEVVEASDEVSCLETLGTLKPDFMLIDWHLRKESGLDLIKKIRALPNGTYTPILIYSGIEQGEFHPEILKAGAVGYLEKPVTKSKAENALKKLQLL